MAVNARVVFAAMAEKIPTRSSRVTRNLVLVGGILLRMCCRCCLPARVCIPGRCTRGETARVFVVQHDGIHDTIGACREYDCKQIYSGRMVLERVANVFSILFVMGTGLSKERKESTEN